LATPPYPDSARGYESVVAPTVAILPLCADSCADGTATRPSSRSTAPRRCAGLRCAYRSVIRRSECPRIPFAEPSGRSGPASSRCVG